ncbi:hypothetical protein QJS66_00510 [Kocuria rhizophila]|nr:hypothetical protein QJS66_00510 [Kocuria rhizophila]
MTSDLARRPPAPLRAPTPRSVGAQRPSAQRHHSAAAPAPRSWPLWAS